MTIRVEGRLRPDQVKAPRPRTDAHAGSDIYRGAFEEYRAVVRHSDGNYQTKNIIATLTRRIG